MKPIKELSGSLNTGPPAPLVLLTPVILLLVYTGFKNYLLFHSIVELWSIIVALSIFLIALNTYPITPNRFFVFLGLAYGFIGIMDPGTNPAGSGEKYSYDAGYRGRCGTGQPGNKTAL